MAKLPGDELQKLSQIRAAYSYMMLHPGCKMMAPDKELTDEMKRFIHDLNEMYVSQPALSLMDNDYEGFEWIQLMKYEENVLTFLRKTENPEETLLAVCNFAAVPYENYQMGVPFYGKYKEIFNSDRKEYGRTGNSKRKGKNLQTWQTVMKENILLPLRFLHWVWLFFPAHRAKSRRTGSSSEETDNCQKDRPQDSTKEGKCKKRLLQKK